MDQHQREALALAEERGMRSLVAHRHLGLGKLYRGSSDPAKAEEHFATATTMYRETGMSFWLEKAEAAMGPPQRNSPRARSSPYTNLARPLSRSH